MLDVDATGKHTSWSRGRSTHNWTQTSHIPNAMPTMKNKEPDNGEIRELSDTLEIVYEGTYDLLEKKVPIDITITLTWVINRRSSGVFQRYKNHPYPRITISFDSKGKLGLIQVPELMFWCTAHHKLLQHQLRCPVLQEFGMDRNPVPHFSNFMHRAEALVEAQQVGTVPVTNLQLHSFLLEQLLGRTGTTTDQLLGIPISWIRDSSNSRTLQAMARAVRPTANPPPNAVAHMHHQHIGSTRGDYRL